MIDKDKGFLLLCSHLGDSRRRVLTPHQMAVLAQRVSQRPRAMGNRDLRLEDLVALGYAPDMAQRILSLFDDRELLQQYLYRAKQFGCKPLVRGTQGYPLRLRQALGTEAPGVLWAKGDVKLLEKPAVALVGSRDIGGKNAVFAAEVGLEAARQGYVLVSGNARGADTLAQDACLEAGGQVISVVADCLARYPRKKNVLYLSENDFDQEFSAQRALSRNRCIHALPEHTFVARSDAHTGGTWDGTVRNLRKHWSGVYCYADGSDASVALQKLGAKTVLFHQLRLFSDLPGWEEKE